jgi:hypothetical protein
MRKFVTLGLVHGMLLAAVVLAGARPAMAQGAKAEFFAGGSFLRNSGTTYSGWNTSITGNMLPWLGVTADFSGHYNSPLSVYTYTVGPRLSVPQDSGLVPFTQATFGVARLSALGAHINGFGAYIGGGLDWIAKEHIAVRLMQLDAQLTRISGNNSSGTRISFGVVFRLGSR